MRTLRGQKECHSRADRYFQGPFEPSHTLGARFMAEAFSYRKSQHALLKAIITHGTGCPLRRFYITGVQSRGYDKLSSPKARIAIGPQLCARGDGVGSFARLA